MPDSPLTSDSTSEMSSPPPATSDALATRASVATSTPSSISLRTVLSDTSAPDGSESGYTKDSPLPLDPFPESGDPEFAPPRQGRLTTSGFTALERELQSFLRRINTTMGMVYPREFAHKVPIAAYQTMVRLCILDFVAWDLTPDEINERAFVPQWYVAKLRRSMEMEEVRQVFRREWDKLVTPKTLQEHIADPVLQDRIAQRTIEMALHGGDIRTVEKAVAQINDRAMPVVSKAPMAPVLMMTPEMATLFAETVRMRQLKEGAIDVEAKMLTEGDGG